MRLGKQWVPGSNVCYVKMMVAKRERDQAGTLKVTSSRSERGLLFQRPASIEAL